MLQIEREKPIEITKSELLGEVQNAVPIPHLMASIEYSIDLMMDMHLKIIDAMTLAGIITLTDTEKDTYDRLKTAQEHYHTFSLANDKFPDGVSVIDYMYHFKTIIMEKRAEYFKAKQEFNIQG
jgi:hypothetical protein